MSGGGRERFERRYRRVRSRSVGLRALDIERRRETRAFPRSYETQRFVMRGRDRTHGLELAQRADENEVAGCNVT